jgi:hypothetical protein
MEYVIKLNLPQLDQVLTAEALSMINVTPTDAVRSYYKPADVMRPEYLTINDFQWNRVYDFSKPSGYTAQIHTDSFLHKCAWGINWIYGADGLLNYWDRNVVVENETINNTLGNLVRFKPTDIPPIKSYYMTPAAYLVNAREPHQAVSIGDRHCISARCSTSYNMSWEEIVEKFSDYIL